MTNRIGIDFGTTYSTMCAMDGNGKPVVLKDGDGNEKIPSLVFWGPDGQVLVGQAAAYEFENVSGIEDEEKRFDAMGRFVRSVKRDFLPDRAIALPDGRTVTPLDCVAEILRYMKAEAEGTWFHGGVPSAVLTHPATFTEAQKSLLREAAGKAGFTDVELLPEPVAAAVGYAATGAELGEGVLVYDLGGGTFDLAYLRRDAGGGFHFPVPPMGDARCGGDDLDQAIYDHAEAELMERSGKRFADSTDEVSLPFLFNCRAAKEKLSRVGSATLRYVKPEEGLAYRSELRREEFERLAQPLLGRTFSMTGRMLDQLGSRGLDVDTVLLIGGSSQIPLVSSSLQDLLGIKPLETMHAETAVAMGAAAWPRLKEASKNM